jgi:hypothetical protein
MVQAVVLLKRHPHLSKAGKVGSKVCFAVGTKKIFMYSSIPIGEVNEELDLLSEGQVVNVEQDGNQFWRFSKDQTIVGETSTSEQIFDSFNGKVITPSELLPVIKKEQTDLLIECILKMKKELADSDSTNFFTSEDCRSAGISLFIQLSKINGMK